ncbi:MAG: hypothetical protein K2Z81_13720 [Cyanobacteria bacterium]|nr:hypothetical protein [Cyanobacteriota bacterium]
MVSGEELDRFDHYLKAGSPSTRLDELIILAGDADSEVRRCVASNVNAPVSLLKLLSEDPNFAVRIAVGTNPSTPRRLIWVLSTDYSEQVRSGLAADPRTPLSILCCLAQDASVSEIANRTLRQLQLSD